MNDNTSSVNDLSVTSTSYPYAGKTPNFSPLGIGVCANFWEFKENCISVVLSSNARVKLASRKSRVIQRSLGCQLYDTMRTEQQ